MKTKLFVKVRVSLSDKPSKKIKDKIVSTISNLLDVGGFYDIPSVQHHYVSVIRKRKQKHA